MAANHMVAQLRMGGIEQLGNGIRALASANIHNYVSTLSSNFESTPSQIGNLISWNSGPQIPVFILAWLAFCISILVLASAFTLLDQPRIANGKYLLRMGLFASRFKAYSKGMYPFFKMMPLVAFNLVAVLLPSMYLFAHLGLCFHSKRPAALEWSLLWRVPCMSAIMSLGHEIIFYVGHRYVLHSRWGLSIFRHDVHHSTKASCALSALYMHPLDFIVEIVLPYLLPFSICSSLSSNLLDLLVPCLGAIGGVYEHSGYNFWPGVKSLDTRWHISHHIKWNVSYADGVGSTNLLDSYFNTVADISKLD